MNHIAPSAEPGRYGIAEMLTLVDRIKRLAFDPSLTDADIARRLRDLLTEHAEGGTPMNVLELTALLEDTDPDAEVLIVSQPSWLLRFTVAGDYDASNHTAPCDPHDAYECSECDSPPEDLNVYVVTGDHPYDGSPYGPWDACDAARTS